MRLLVTNDDGVYSPGIQALTRVASRFGHVRVVAPDVEQSSASHAITHSRPLTVRRTLLEACRHDDSSDGLDAWRVNGTPADCVTLGAAQWEGVDVVLSGINLGPNLGNSMWHSGTLAAAKQAALLGLRGIALSTPVVGDLPDFERLEPWVERVLALLLPDPDLALVNVNLPPEPRGLRWTRQSVRQYDGRVVAGKDPMGRPHHWITAVPLEEADEGTDRFAVEQGLVSITPLRLDLTDHDALASARRRHPLEGEERGISARSPSRAR